MRVSELTKHNTVRGNLSQNAQELQEIQTNLSNGKVLNKPSDDPVGAAKVQEYRTSINHAKNIEKNIGSDKVWLNASETAIGQMVESMMGIKSIAMEGGSGAATKEQRIALSNDVELTTKELVKLANAKTGKLHLFSGTKTFTEPLEMNARILEAESLYVGTRVKSATSIIPLNQNEPIPGLKPGLLTLTLTPTDDKISEFKAMMEEKLALEANPDPMTADEQLEADSMSPGERVDAAAEESAELDAAAIPGELDADGNPIEGADADAVEGAEEAESIGPKLPPLPSFAPPMITVALNGTESVNEVIQKINEAAIAQEGYTEDPHGKLGYKTRLSAEMGPDNHLYLDPAKGYNFTMGPDMTGFLDKMGFITLSSGDSVPQTAETTEAEDAEGGVGQAGLMVLPKELYNAQFKGYSKESYIVKVVEGGSYGTARYIVSDDGGESWSKIQALNKQNEIYNPDGKANDKVMLQFGTEGEPFFREGVEFHFDSNEFVEYKGNDQIKLVPIDNGIKVALNITARELFHKSPEDSETVNGFDVLNRLIEALADDDSEAVLESLQDIDTSINQLLKKQGHVGSVMRELEASEVRMADEVDSKQTEISEIEDLDLAKGAIDLNQAEVKHKVALDSAARLVQPTLINFLK